MKRLSRIAAAVSITLFAGCATMTPAPAPSSQISQGAPAAVHKVSAPGGKTSGSACGIDLFDLLPIGVWNRTQRAYDSAVSQAGARALLGQTVSDSRFDLMVATVKCSSVEGTAVY